jgi:hypothetical protein
MSEPAPEDFVAVPPAGAKVFDHIFPRYAFTSSGEVYLIRSEEPLLIPKLFPADRVAEPGSLNPDRGTSYRVISKSGHPHRVTRASIKELFLKGSKGAGL